MKPIIDQQTLRELFNYDADTGIFTRRVTRNTRHPAGAAAGWVSERGYVRIKINGHTYMGHRLAWVYMHGTEPPEEVDHINGVKTDNRICNLRLATRIENCRNAAIPLTNKTGICGIFHQKKHGKWHAYIHAGGKHTYLGSYNTKREAAEARAHAEKEEGYHENHGKTKEARQRASVS